MGDHVVKLEFSGSSEQQADVVAKAYEGGLRLL